MCNDLAKAMKALDGKKSSSPGSPSCIRVVREEVAKHQVSVGLPLELKLMRVPKMRRDANGDFLLHHYRFFLSAPVAFRRVALDTPEWTSRDSNHHRQSVSAGKTNAIPTEPSGRLLLHHYH